VIAKIAVHLLIGLTLEDLLGTRTLLGDDLYDGNSDLKSDDAANKTEPSDIKIDDAAKKEE
jgi:hypothetical protein